MRLIIINEKRWKGRRPTKGLGRREPCSTLPPRGRMRMKLVPMIAAAALASSGIAAAQAPDAADRRIERILRATPLIDGHNDLPWEIREKYDFWRKPLDLARDTASLPDPLQTDI